MTIEQATDPIRDAVRFSTSVHELTLLVGGNNAVTRPGVLGLGLPLEKVGLITLDAHFDMRDTHEGLSNGNPVRALINDGLPGANIAQIGLAAFANSKKMHDDAVATGNLVITIGEVGLNGIARAIERALEHVEHCDAIVVDCDIDVIDRSQLPGAPGGRPGGMTVSDFFKAVRFLASQRAVRVIDLDGVGSAVGSDRPQCADRGAMGRRVPCRLRDALSLRGFLPAEIGHRSKGDREAKVVAGHDPVLPLVACFTGQSIRRARLYPQVEACEARRCTLSKPQDGG